MEVMPQEADSIPHLCGEEREKVAAIDAELRRIGEQIHRLSKARRDLLAERDSLVANSVQKQAVLPSKDYTRRDFDWSPRLLSEGQRVFGIESFRLCQEDVCNAAMDNRDAIVIMPTGAGKSLCYQLPGIMSDKLTLVISPLVALINDQVMNLREHGVACACLQGSSDRATLEQVLRSIKAPPGERPQLLYVTPERISKSKRLLSILDLVYKGDGLGRIVIDEAHCCSQLGHDYRPDYRRLAILRSLYPKVPIMGLTATMSPNVLKDVLGILGLPSVTTPDAAANGCTVYFRAPLRRKNLTFSVSLSPPSKQSANEALVKYIMEHHQSHSGIVYCFSRKETYTTAEELERLSRGAIRTGVYNADVDDETKALVHRRWRTGEIHVVCATIAFGMGIDKGNVRFVVHTCMSKSVDAYYQEAGRAGRDGSSADCVLMYRPADMVRLNSITAYEMSAQEKVHGMLDYAQTPQCRSIFFAKYFEDPSDDLQPCGTCDNCKRGPPDSLVTDLSFPAWQVVQMASRVTSDGGRPTFTLLADIASGRGRRMFTDGTGSVVRFDDSFTLGHTGLGRNDCERLIIQLLVAGYLQEDLGT